MASLAFFCGLLQLLVLVVSRPINKRITQVVWKVRYRKMSNDRVETVNMTELKRNALSLKMMFGSPRTWFAVLVVLLVTAGGYLAYNYFSDPSRALRQADEKWNRDKNVEAVREYKTLLMQRDPLDNQYALIQGPDRPRLYRRIITHEARFGNRGEARDWISKAYGEGINFERADFENDEVHQLWLEVVADYKDPADARKDRSLLDEMNKKE